MGGILERDAVAIDGPVGSGKTTVGRLVAERLGILFLDTGLMYRATTWAAIEKGIDLQDKDALSRMTSRLEIRLVQSPTGNRLIVNSADVTDDLGTPEVEEAVSQVSAVKGVRESLVPQQRGIAEESSVVMVGRDIGTVVLPNAGTKIYLQASVDVRADRRFVERARCGASIDRERVRREIEERDRIDSNRAESPLSVAEGALVVDTDDMDIDEVTELIIGAVEGRQ